LHWYSYTGIGRTSSLTFGIFSEFELKGCGGNHFCQFSRAVGTFLCGGVRHFLLQFKQSTTGIALVFIYWHW
jgi:hypothetical protein